jgi:uncharacterized protein YicC (UPF0701 family)
MIQYRSRIEKKNKMKKFLCVFFALFASCCHAMNDVHEDFSEESREELAKLLKIHGVTKLNSSVIKLKQSKKGELSTSLQGSIEQLGKVTNFLNLVSTDDDDLNAIEDSVLDKLCVEAYNSAERFAEVYRQRQVNRDFGRGDAERIQQIKCLLPYLQDVQ